MDTLEAIRTRRTVGKSTGDVSRQTIAELIETATLAPNHKLTQP
jgi:nitroreductase